LERQLVRQIHKAKEKAGKVLGVYGGKFCYVNADNPTRIMQKIIAEQGPGVTQIQATHCMDMIADEEERDRFKSLLAEQAARLQAE
jgi:dienelactone hydrolase